MTNIICPKDSLRSMLFSVHMKAERHSGCRYLAAKSAVEAQFLVSHFSHGFPNFYSVYGSFMSKSKPENSVTPKRNVFQVTGIFCVCHILYLLDIYHHYYYCHPPELTAIKVQLQVAV